MATLGEIRAQYPQYNDMSDQQLADGIYKKFYSDMPREQFDAKIGLKAPPVVMPDNALGASTRGISDMLPGGSFMDEAVGYSAAAIDPIANLFRSKPVEGDFWERADKHIGNQRATAQQSYKDHPTANAVGNVGAVAAMAPKAVAGLAAPVMRSATLGERAINAGIAGAKGAVGGAGYGALQGFGAGEDGFGNRVEEAGRQGAIGLGAGAVLGAGLGSLAKMPMAPPPSRAAAASQRSGVYLPEALASDIPAVQQAGGAAKSIPFFGTRMTKAGQRTTDEFVGEKARIAEGYGGGAAANAQSAGHEARDALENWIGPLTKGVLSKEYNAVDALVNPTVATPLSHTLFETKAIAAKNVASGLPEGGAVKVAQVALAKPGGMTYQEIKHLRTKIGEMLDTPGLLTPDLSGQELKRLYGALSKDLRASVKNGGGQAALNQFEKANALNAAVEKRREELVRVLGINPANQASPEAVFAAIYRKAGSKSSADIAIVNKIRKSMPPDAWDQVASGVVGELGRSPAIPGEVSLDRFFTGYNQIPDAGKAALFGNKPDLKAALDDLAEIAGRGKEVAKWANPSGTAQHGAYIAIAAAATQPYLWPKLVTGAIGAHILTKALTRPASVRAMSAWARVWQANHVNRLVGGGPSQKNIKSLEFVSRRFASEIGLQFNLGVEQVRQIADSLQGAPPATAEPEQPTYRQ